MSAVKERILGAVTIMNDTDAATVWNFIVNQLHDHEWDNIEATTPDELDMEMLREIQDDPDCHQFVSSDEAMKQLGLK